jgi:hypothetical protein
MEQKYFESNFMETISNGRMMTMKQGNPCYGKFSGKVLIIVARLALFVGAYTLFAQSEPVKIKWGKEFTAPRNSSLSDIIGFDKSGFYVLRGRAGLFTSSTLSLERFDKNLNKAKSIDLELVEGGKKSYLEEILHLNGRLLMFSSFPDQSTKNNILFVHNVSKQTLMPDFNSKKKLAEINYEGNSKRNSGSFSFRLSNDSSKILIFYALPYEFGDPEKFGFLVLDNQLNTLWKKDIVLPYRDDLFDIETTKVDNYGNAYMLGLLFKDKRRERRKGEANYEYKVLSYTDGGENSNEYSVSLPDRFLTDMQIGVRANKDIVCAGFYSEMGTLSIRGTFFLSIDAKTKEIKTKSFKEFDIDFITQNMTEREADRAKRKEGRGREVELYEYDLDKLIVRSDGGAMLIGEQFFVKTQTYTTYINRMPTTRTVTYYNYNDIIMVNIDPTGNIDWAIKVPKRQVSIDDGGFFSSYAMAINKDKIYFVYNDNPDNLGYTGVGRVSSSGGRNQVVMVAEVNSKGEMKRKPLGAGMGEVITRPKVCEQISYSEMILFGQRRKTQQFGLISFE